MLAESAIFTELQLIRSGPLILGRSIVALLTLCAVQRYNNSHRTLLGLGNNFRNNTRTNGTATFTNSKTKFFFHGDGGN